MRTAHYDEGFYDAQRALSLRSAREIVPLVVEMVRPTSVVDVGCGVGTWLRAFVDGGVTDVIGVEGPHVAGMALEIEERALVTADLSSGELELPRTFDLAVSMEVAEHLSEDAARPFVRSLTKLAPAVLFGAAVPTQGGDGHVNEQWQHWWAERFAEVGFVPRDVIRPRVWATPDVAWWYAQNTLIYVREDTSLASELEPLQGQHPISIVHPAMLLERVAASDAATLGDSLRHARSALGRAVAARLGRSADVQHPETRHTTLERLRDVR